MCYVSRNFCPDRTRRDGCRPLTASRAGPCADLTPRPGDRPSATRPPPAAATAAGASRTGLGLAAGLGAVLCAVAALRLQCRPSAVAMAAQTGGKGVGPMGVTWPGGLVS